MKTIGLYPSSTGKEDGRETGDCMSHYIVPGGPFEVAAQKLLMAGFAIAWTEMSAEDEDAEAPVEGPEGSTEPKNGPKSGKRVKYTCPTCRLNAWAKHRVQLLCGSDMTPMEPAPSKDAMKKRGADRRSTPRSLAIGRLAAGATLPPCRCPPPRRE
jgi:hypothetical protein